MKSSLRLLRHATMDSNPLELPLAETWKAASSVLDRAGAELIRLLRHRFGVELAQERGEFFLLIGVQDRENFRGAFFKERKRRRTKLRALFGQNNMHDAPIILVAFARHQLLFLEPVHDTG